MRPRQRVIVFAIVCMLSACSRAPNGDGKTESSSPAAKAAQAANAEFARLQKQGADATAREITKIEYPMTRSLMKTGGIDAALGGEAKADVALQKLFALYEQKSRAFASELPTLGNSHAGGGGDGVGSGDMSGHAGTAVSTGMSGIQNEMAEQAWERGQKEGQSSGSHSVQSENGSATTEWDQNGYTSTTSIDGFLPEGLKGKVTTRIKSVACPDAEGKVEVEFESSSSLGSASGSAQTKVSSKLVKHLDDDANLHDDDMDSDVRVEQTTGSGSHVDISDALSTSRGEMGTTVNGRSRNTRNEDVEMAKGLANVGRMAAMNALDAAKKAWESGKCVKLDVRSDPAKRTGAKPNTAYTLFAEPRAKSDSAPTRGTVKATLSGEHMLNPRDKKVPADAQFDYQNPEKKDQSATIDFEARSKRGVGKASLQFDTKKGGYRIALDNGESITTCDITKPFSGKIGGGMITLTFTPKDEKSGTMAFHFAGGGGIADSTYNYTLSGPEEKMTGPMTANSAVCGSGSGRTVCAAARHKTFSSTWTKIDDCGSGK